MSAETPADSHWSRLAARLRTLSRTALGPAGVYLAATLFAKTASFVLIPIYTRKLSNEDYGDLVLAQTFISVLPTFLSLGLASALVAFYYDSAVHATARRRVGGVACWLASITLATCAVLQVAVVWLPAGMVPGLPRWELSCIIWAAAGAALAEVPAYYLRAAQRAFAAAGFQIAQFFSLVISGLVLVAWMGRGRRGAVEALTLGYGIDGLAGLLFILVILRGPMTLAILKEGLRFSLPLIPHTLANQIQNVMDRWALSGAGLKPELGVYGLACQVVQPAQMTVASWNQAASPKMGEVFREEGSAGLLKTHARSQRSYLLVAIGASLVTILAIPLLNWIVGPNFRSALFVAPFLTLGVLIESLYFPNYNELFYLKRVAVIPFATGSSALLNVVLCIALVGSLGMTGVIAARMIALAYRSWLIWYCARSMLRNGSEPQRHRDRSWSAPEGATTNAEVTVDH